MQGGASTVASDPLVLPAPFLDTDFPAASPEEIRLGQLLFHDPILSGNRNIACVSCHHPTLATGDGVSLGIGEGGIGLGPERRPDPENAPEQRIPRNSPPLFNLGARQVTTLFHDGRIERDESRPGGFRTPLLSEMSEGFSGLLSAQTMFPVLSPDEMAGHYGENEISKRVRLGMITGPDGAWAAIAARVAAIDEYRALFAAAYPSIASGQSIGFTDISNAIAAFMADEWRADQTPFDAHLRGEATLPTSARLGMQLFYGRAGCAECHSGTLLSDQRFHAMGQPQLGPGKAERFESHQRDEGRFRITGDPSDAYAFRTPPLRNVMQTGPWGHAGAYDDMRLFLRAHLSPGTAVDHYEQSAVLPPLDGIAADWSVMQDASQREAIRAAADPRSIPLDDDDTDALMAFMDALTDPQSLKGRSGMPSSVPSGLPIDR